MLEFMESGALLILTKQKEKVPFRLNFVQQRLAQYVAWCWHTDRPVYCLIPKFRQGGVTTFWQALNFALCVLSTGHRAATISHTEESVEMIFDISRRFERNLPARFREPLANRQGGKLVWEKDCSIWVAGAKAGDAVGKGPTLNALHGSEVANWADKGNDPYEVFESCMGAVAKNAHTIVALESTAKGRDQFFYAMCEEARLGRNAWAILFFPWFLDAGYRLSWAEYRALKGAKGIDAGVAFVPTEDERLLRDEVASPVRQGEETWRYQAHLTDEQLIWRRFTIEQDYGGKVERFRRYYPATLEEAFAATDSTLFDAATLAHYFATSQPAFAVGRLDRDPETGEVRFSRDSAGELSLWAEPEPGGEYVIGVDVAAGKRGGDPCAAVVMHKRDRRVVAVLHGAIEWDTLSAYLYLLGEHFNDALLVVERNYNPAVVAQLHREGYPNLYHYVDETRLKGSPTLPGWSTNRKTRPLMMERLAACVRHRTLQHPDRRFAQELSTLVWWERQQHHAAASGKHDDLIMATAMALVMCYWEEKEGEPALAPQRSLGERLLERVRGMQLDTRSTLEREGALYL